VLADYVNPVGLSYFPVLHGSGDAMFSVASCKQLALTFRWLSNVRWCSNFALRFDEP
jgi:hypothetical protein